MSRLAEPVVAVDRYRVSTRAGRSTVIQTNGSIRLDSQANAIAAGRALTAIQTLFGAQGVFVNEILHSAIKSRHRALQVEAFPMKVGLAYGEGADARHDDGKKRESDPRRAGPH